MSLQSYPENREAYGLGIKMAVDLNCPNCGDNLGKDVENDFWAYCGRCGKSNIYNERGENPRKKPDKN